MNTAIPSLPVIVASLVAIIASFSRVFAATKPLWGKAPGWFQVLAPALLPALAALSADLGHVQSGTDLTVAVVTFVALLMPGMPSHRSDAPLPSNPKGPPTGIASAIAFGIGLSLLSVTGCAALAAISPYVAQAAVIISDAVNAINAAEAMLPSLHLGADQQAATEKLIARLRAAASAAAKADAGVSDLTAEQLDASLADFRAAWADLQGVFAAQRKLGAGSGAEALPVPLALKRVSK